MQGRRGAKARARTTEAKEKEAMRYTLSAPLPSSPRSSTHRPQTPTMGRVFRAGKWLQQNSTRVKRSDFLEQSHRNVTSLPNCRCERYQGMLLWCGDVHRGCGREHTDLCINGTHLNFRRHLVLFLCTRSMSYVGE
jgi:hypothetical protein